MRQLFDYMNVDALDPELRCIETTVEISWSGGGYKRDIRDGV
jgi:hypothetical protein